MSNNRNEDLDRLAEIFKALSNGHRLKIFSRLASCCAGDESCYIDGKTSACVGEIAQDLNLAPSTVSHHIKELYRAGLLAMERQGRSVRCSVVPEMVQELAEFFRILTIADSECGEAKSGKILGVEGSS